MVLSLVNIPEHSAENTLYKNNKRIASLEDQVITIGSAGAASLLAVAYPMGFNKSTKKHGPWAVPDATVLVITLTGATGGTFGMSINNLVSENTAFDFDISAAELQARLLAFGFSTTVVLDNLIYTITFDGTDQIETLPTVSVDITQITGDITESVTVNDGVAQTASPTIINIDMEDRTGGTFTITYDGNESAGIAFAASALDIENAILAIGTHAPDSVSVSRRVGVNEIYVEFDDIADLLSLPTVSFTSSLSGGTGDSDIVTVGDVLSLASASEVEIEIGTATGGTFTVTANGLTTAGIAFDATAGEVDTALANIGFTVVTDLTSTLYTIVFSGKDEVIELPTLSGNISSLTGAGIGGEATAGTATNGLQRIRGFINPYDAQSGITTGSVALVVLTGSDTTATATQTTPHGLATGMSLTMSGATESLLNVTATITVTTPFSYTYTVSAVSGGTTDSGAYTTTNDVTRTMMIKGTIRYDDIAALIATANHSALQTALRNDLIPDGLIVQGLTQIH